MLQQVGRRLASDKRWWGGDDAERGEASAVSCEPTTTGEWRVRVANAVGVVRVKDVEILVQPKIPTDHLLFLFAKSDEFPRLDSTAAALSSSRDLWELVARWFTSATEELLRRDLIRDYQDWTEDLAVIRGKVDPLSVVDFAYRGKVQFSCEFDEFTIDTALNRILKAAAQTVTSSVLLDSDVRRRGLRLLSRFEEVGDLRAEDWRHQIDRRTAHYRTATQLARHVLTGEGRGLAHGTSDAFVFLLPTPRLIEDGLRTVLREALYDYDVQKRGIQLEGTSLTFNPDIVFDGGIAVGDVKYKISAGSWTRSDLYEVLAFATAYQSVQCALFDFRHSSTTSLKSIKVGDIEVAHVAWPVGDNYAPAQAAAEFVADAQAWLGTATN